jgi:hypothetical protein
MLTYQTLTFTDVGGMGITTMSPAPALRIKLCIAVASDVQFRGNERSATGVPFAKPHDEIYVFF